MRNEKQSSAADIDIMAVESRTRRIAVALARLEEGSKTAQIGARRRVWSPWYGFKANMAIPRSFVLQPLRRGS